MSSREMFKSDVDTMPEDIFVILQAMWTFAKKRESAETPNAKTREAMLEAPVKSFSNFNEYMEYIDGMDDDEDV